jgi:hypothetical protein
VSEQIKVTYDGVEIIYRENDDRWQFELRGRERSAESLAKAKEAIDKPEPVKKVAFERMKAYVRPRYGNVDKYLMGEVTSIAEGRNFSNRREVWVVVGKDREKRDEFYVFEISAANDATLAEIARLAKEIEALEEQKKAAHGRMQKLVIPVVE